MKLDVFTIHITPQSEGQFFIYVTDENGVEVRPGFWKQPLFFWHQESFFGTFLEEQQAEGHEGISIDGYSLVTLLGNERFHSLVRWEWAEPADALLAVAPIMLEAIGSGNWVPEFVDGEEESWHWQVPQIVWDEFAAPFWKQDVYGEPMRSFASRFFGTALTSFLEKGHGGAELARKLKELEESPLTAEEKNHYFDEEKWREWSGISGEEPAPYTIGIRLTEPKEDEEDWLLETVARDPKRPDRLYTLERKSKLPKRLAALLPEINKEQERWIKLFPWLSAEDGTLARTLEESEAWEFLTDASGKLLALGIEILLPSWWEAMREASLNVKAKLKSTAANYRPAFVGLDAMLDFDWRISMNGIDLSEEEFADLVQQERRLVQIRGRWVKLDPKMIAHIQALMVQAKKEGLRVQDIFSLAQDEAEMPADVEEWDPRAFARVQIELNQSMRKMLDQLNGKTQIPMTPVPQLLQGELRPYQQLGFDWLVFLRQFGFGACLADDMGLGKTIQLIAYLTHVRFVEKQEMPALIICPTSVLGNWQRELERFSPSLRVKLHYGANRAKGEKIAAEVKDADVVLTTYGLASIDFEELSVIDWSSISLDEAQNIKNADTKQSKAIRKLKGRHHIALTGTPMENRLAELWSIYDFTNHGYLGTFGQFQRKFIAPIEKDGDEKKIRELQMLIKPFLLRRTKKDPEVELNLPDKLEQKEYCALTTEQAVLYEQLVQNTFQKIGTLTHFERKGLILQMLNRLKQLCNHPALYLKEEEPAHVEERSNKLAVLIELGDAIMENGEACIIFTQYIAMGEMIRELLEERYGVTVPFLNGSMPKAKRDQYVERFQAGEFPFFILSLKAGGTGLNLTAANHVIHYDRWWNPAVENQATDRAYRIGQNRFVHVHKLITTGTLEEKIDMMLEKKQSLNDEIIRSDQWVTELSNEELESLLALG